MRRFQNKKTKCYNFEAAAAASLQDTELGFAIVIRRRVPASVHRGSRSFLLEKADQSNPDATVASAENGYYIVHETQSVVFISPNGRKGIFIFIFTPATISDHLVDFTIELVVIRGVATNAPFSNSLYDWLHDVVQTACGHRRNVRVSLILME